MVKITLLFQFFSLIFYVNDDFFLYKNLFESLYSSLSKIVVSK